MKVTGANPIVVRAFRTGFRPGPGSFRIGIWGVILVGVLLWPVYRFIGDEALGLDGAARLLLGLLLFYTAATFLVGGLHRMLVSFSQERERGTFDFLHLSTMSPSAVVGGFLFAGQLPGYLLLFFTLPVQVLAAWLAGFDVAVLFALLLVLAGYVVFLSLLFMLIGFWIRKAADLRAGTPMLIGGFLAAASLISMNLVVTLEWGPAAALGVIGGFPVLYDLWTVGFGGRGVSIGFFGAQLPLAAMAFVALTPPGVIGFRCLTRSMRYRERKPIADGAALLLIAWVHFIVVGIYWDAVIPMGHRLVIFTLGSWLGLTWLLQRTMRPRAAVVRQLARHRGSLAALVRDPEGPPYRLVGFVLMELVLFWSLQLLGPSMGPPDWSVWLTVLCLWLPLVATFLLDQYVSWRVGRWGSFLVGLVQGLILWGPYFLYLFLDATTALLPASVSEGMLQLVASLSPLSQVQSGVMEGSPILPASRALGIVFSQLGFGVLIAGLVVLHVRWLRQIAHSVPGGSRRRGASPPQAAPTTVG